MLTLRRRDSELVLRRYHQTSGGRSQGVAGFIALPRSPFHERPATHRCRSLCGGRQARRTTDVVTDPNLPGKRLIWAAAGGEYYVVHYERGGIAHTFHILVAKLTKNDTKPNAVWRAVGGPLKDYAAFVDALQSGKLDDRLDYAH